MSRTVSGALRRLPSRPPSSPRAVTQASCPPQSRRGRLRYLHASWQRSRGVTHPMTQSPVTRLDINTTIPYPAPMSRAGQPSPRSKVALWSAHPREVALRKPLQRGTGRGTGILPVMTTPGSKTAPCRTIDPITPAISRNAGILPATKPARTPAPHPFLVTYAYNTANELTSMTETGMDTKLTYNDWGRTVSKQKTAGHNRREKSARPLRRSPRIAVRVFPHRHSRAKRESRGIRHSRVSAGMTGPLVVTGSPPSRGRRGADGVRAKHGERVDENDGERGGYDVHI